MTFQRAVNILCILAVIGCLHSTWNKKPTDRTASQHLWGSRDVIDHVTIW